MKGKYMWEFWNTCLWWIWAFPLQKEYFVCVLGESTLRLPQPDPLKRSDWWEWEKTLSPWCSNKQSSAHLKFTTSSISRSLSRISCNTSRRRKLSRSITACSRSSTMESRLRSHLFCDFIPVGRQLCQQYTSTSCNTRDPTSRSQKFLIYTRQLTSISSDDTS